MINPHAKLFVPSNRDQQKSLEWRVRLIDQEGLFKANDLVSLINGLLNPNARNENWDDEAKNLVKKDNV